MLSLLFLCGSLSANLVSADPPVDCHDWPNTCPGTFPTTPQSWLMNKSTIIMPCNNTGYTDPESTKGWAVVDFDWSNAKGKGGNDGWVKHKPMDDMEMMEKQVVCIIHYNRHYRN